MFPGPGASAPSAPSPGCSPSARPSWSRSLGPDPGPGLAASDREAAGPHQAVRRLRRWAGGPKGWRCCTFFLRRPVGDRWYFNDPPSQGIGSARMNVQWRPRSHIHPVPGPPDPEQIRRIPRFFAPWGRKECATLTPGRASGGSQTEQAPGAGRRQSRQECPPARGRARRPGCTHRRRRHSAGKCGPPHRSSGSSQ